LVKEHGKKKLEAGKYQNKPSSKRKEDSSAFNVGDLRTSKANTKIQEQYNNL
jgi:hypothetical protein